MGVGGGGGLRFTDCNACIAAGVSPVVPSNGIQWDHDGIFPRNVLIRIEARNFYGYPSDLDGYPPANPLIPFTRAIRKKNFAESVGSNRKFFEINKQLHQPAF
jgi:hypothetical protein